MMSGSEFFWLNGTIEEEFIDAIIPGIANAQQENPRDEVVLWISSPGGAFESALAFFDFIKAKKVNLTTIGIGQVSSSGVLVWSCGKVRKATRHCRFLFHEPHRDFLSGESGCVSLTRQDCDQTKSDLRKIHSKLCRLMARQLGVSAKSISRLASEETWLTARDAEKMGLLHQII